MEILLKTRARQQSDDLIAQNKILDRFNSIKSEFENLVKTVDFTLCPLVTCLFENQCIQLQCEEQEDLDKLKIAMYGNKDNLQAQSERLAHMQKEKQKQELLESKQA